MPRTLRLGLTGTPGTGKTAVASALRTRGIPVIDLAELASDCGALGGLDRQRGTRVVDEIMLADAFETTAAVLAAKDALVVGEGHYAHDLRVDVVAVLRTAPAVLLSRLAARGWPPGKVRENVEAEAMGIIAWETLDSGRRAFEVDTTLLSAEEAAGKLLAGARQPRPGPAPRPGLWDVADLPWM